MRYGLHWLLVMAVACTAGENLVLDSFEELLVSGRAQFVTQTDSHSAEDPVSWLTLDILHRSCSGVHRCCQSGIFPVHDRQAAYCGVILVLGVCSIRALYLGCAEVWLADLVSTIRAFSSMPCSNFDLKI